jgi:hypothetical protein
MKSYLITINIRDGEHEYTDKTILELTDEQTENPSGILSLWQGLSESEEPVEVYSTWYELDSNYRHYQVYHIQEIEAEHARILRLYGIY